MVTSASKDARAASKGINKLSAFFALTAVGVFASISAIASVTSMSLLKAEAEITEQILIVEEQEKTARASNQLDALLTPRTGLSWKRSAFPVASNPVLLAELEHDKSIKTSPEALEVSTLHLIQDTAAFGELTLDRAPKLTFAPKKRGQAHWQCLAEAIYFEARSEDVQAQRAVAEVILNRTDSRRFPDTICEVVNQGANRRHRCQFSYNCDGIPEAIHNQTAWKRAKSIAKEMVVADERPLTKGATHYHASYVRPTWSRSLTRTARYGAHIFYREGTRISRR